MAPEDAAAYIAFLEGEVERATKIFTDLAAPTVAPHARNAAMADARLWCADHA